MSSAGEGRFAVEVQGLEKHFLLGFRRRRFEALRGISFSTLRGACFGFLGPNGAGKTTTIKTLVGLIFPSAGEARVLGGSPSHPQVRRRFGYLPENPAFHDHLTAREVLSLACALLQVPAEQRSRRIAEMLELVGLSRVTDLQVRRFSKGMVQRLGIAQALLHEPELVILDEPMSGLDPVGRRDIKDLIKRLHEQNRTVFFSTHIIADVEELCDEVAILVGGKLVRSGPVAQLLGGGEKEMELLATDVPESFPGRAGSTSAGLVAFRASDLAGARELAERLWAAGSKVVSMNVRRYSLEDVFMSEVAKSGPEQRVVRED